VGESINFAGHLDWLREAGVKIIELHDEKCIALMQRFITESPQIWFEDIGESDQCQHSA
jgi:cytosine deaminase